MKIVFIGYRRWALEILDFLIGSYYNFEVSALITSDKQCEDVALVGMWWGLQKYFLQNENDKYHILNILDFHKPDLVLVYGWSWIIPEEIINKYECICLHPSPLPKYRGGSPIQNQIIDGRKDGAVTLFKMTPKLDAGPIFDSKPLCLEGGLNNIFNEITNIGIGLTINLIENFKRKTLKYTTQNEKEATYCKRRKPEDSEITIEEIKTKSAEYLYNKVRALQYPYPEPYIGCGDGSKLYIKLVVPGKGE